jgi:DNA-binding transcriptional regulator YiaG
MPIPVSVAKKLALRRRLPAPAMRRAIRVAAGLTQAELASCLPAPVHRETVARWEAGVRTPRGELLLAYVQLLDELAKGTA